MTFSATSRSSFEAVPCLADMNLCGIHRSAHRLLRSVTNRPTRTGYVSSNHEGVKEKLQVEINKISYEKKFVQFHVHRSYHGVNKNTKLISTDEKRRRNG